MPDYKAVRDNMTAGRYMDKGTVLPFAKKPNAHWVELDKDGNEMPDAEAKKKADAKAKAAAKAAAAKEAAAQELAEAEAKAAEQAAAAAAAKAAK